MRQDHNQFFSFKKNYWPKHKNSIIFNNIMNINLINMNQIKGQTRILFIYCTLSSFVKNDIDILNKHFNVKTIKWNGKKAIFKIAFEVFKSDLSFIWFAEDHTAVSVFFSKLFRKKSVVIAGGYDVISLPEIGYGRFTYGRLRKFLTKYSLKNADIVLAVSNFVKKQTIEKIKVKEIKVVYNGIDTEKFKPTNKQKENIIVTIAMATENKYQIKGLETFAKASIDFPNLSFVIIGKSDEIIVKKLKNINPKLIFTGEITYDEVYNWLKKAKVYCQLSYIESFGMGVAEAMSCKSIPVVTNKGGLTEVVGDEGFYTPYGDEKTTIKSIKKALKVSDLKSEKIRRRIIDKFQLKKREEELIKIIEELMLKRNFVFF